MIQFKEIFSHAIYSIYLFNFYTIIFFIISLIVEQQFVKTLETFYKNIFYISFILLKDIPSLFRESIYIYKYYYNIIALLLYTTHFMEISFFYISISRKIFYCYQEKALHAYAYKYKMLKTFR